MSWSDDRNRVNVKLSYAIAVKHLLNPYHAMGRVSRRQTGDIFHIFYRKWDLTFHANCLPRKTLAQDIFSLFIFFLFFPYKQGCHCMLFISSEIEFFLQGDNFHDTSNPFYWSLLGKVRKISPWKWWKLMIFLPFILQIFEFTLHSIFWIRYRKK